MPHKTASDNQSNGKRILFFVPFGHWSVHNQVDAVLATAVKLRGAEVQLVGCDGLYPTCDVLAWSGTAAIEACQQCAKVGKEFFSSFDLPLRQMREYLKPDDSAVAKQWAGSIPTSNYHTAEWNGLPIGKWATSSVFSYFRITVRGLSRPDVQTVHRQFLVNSVVTWLVLSRILDKFLPTRCCIFNGRMAPFRIAFELCRRRGLDVITHERGVVDDSFLFYENQTCLALQPIYNCVKDWKSIPLSQAECSDVKNYLASREKGMGLNYPSFYGYSTDPAGVRRTLGIPHGVKVLLALTSSEFEIVDNEYWQSVASQLDILDRVIEVFRNRQEFLVIRHHPNIAGNKSFPPDYEFLSRVCRQARQAPANVRIIFPSENISSYALYWNVDSCIAFYTSAGFETAARGLATASLINSPFQDAVSRVIGEDNLDSLDDIVSDLFLQTENFGLDELRRVYRFLHTYTTKFSKRFKSFGIKNHFESDLRFRNLIELAPAHDSELDVVCNHLLSGMSLWAKPSTTNENANCSEETRFLLEELSSINERRQCIQKQNRISILLRLSPPVGILSLGLSKSHIGEFRYNVTRCYECDLPASPTFLEVIRRISDSLKSIPEQYVMIRQESIWHMESFLSSAVNQLLDDARCELSGIFFGGWLSFGNSEISGEIFTLREATSHYDDAVSLLPALGETPSLLCFGVFRKSKLGEILESLCQTTSGSTPPRRLFDTFQQPCFHWEPTPMLVFNSDNRDNTGNMLC